MKKFLCAALAVGVCATAVAGLSGCGCSKSNSEIGYVVETTAPDLENGDFGFYILNKNELMITKYKGSSKDVEIPETYNDYTVTAIGSYVFDGTDITSVTMPDTITEIGDYTFSSCRSLESVKLSANLKTLGADAFFACSSLESIELPASIEDIGIYTFTGAGLKSVTIPESETFTTIGGYVFYQCPQLTEVNIPSTVTKIDEGAFAQSGETVTINAPSGSYAEEYAQANDLEFVATE